MKIDLNIILYTHDTVLGWRSQIVSCGPHRQSWKPRKYLERSDLGTHVSTAVTAGEIWVGHLRIIFSNNYKFTRPLEFVMSLNTCQEYFSKLIITYFVMLEFDVSYFNLKIKWCKCIQILNDKSKMWNR